MKLWQKNIIGLIFGLIIGSLWHGGEGLYKAISMFFLNSLKMVAIPLVFFSLIRAIGNFTNSGQIKTTTIRSLLLFFGSGLLAALLGLAVGLLILPETIITNQPNISSARFSFEISNLVPSNFLSHFINDQIQPIILLALFVAYALSQLESDSSHLSKAINVITELLVKMLEIVISFTPFGVAGTVAMLAATIEYEMIAKLRDWVLVLGTAYLIQLIFFAFVVLLATKLSPVYFFKKSRGYQILALATGSSKASLPVTMQLAKDRLGISSGKAMLLLPIGASINMIGLGIYLTVTTLFLANSCGVSLNFYAYVFLIFLATLAPIGTAGIAGGALMILPATLSAIGVPLEVVALVIAVDPLINGVRTMINVTGDVVIVMLVDIWDKSFNHKTYQE